jgi:uncharacterized protein YjbI with pentapeptide repeats
VIALSALWAYEQYLEHNSEVQQSQAEQDFTWATGQLTSESPAVRAAAIRTISDLAFLKSPLQKDDSLAPPITNFLNWFRRQKKYKFNERALALLEQYAQADRGIAKAGTDEVSSVLLETAAGWSDRERIAYGRVEKAPWMLSRANLSRGQGPSLTLSGFQLPGANLTHVDFRSAQLNDVNLQGAFIDGLNCESCALNKATLLFARNQGVPAVFNFASMQSVSAKGSVLDNSDFSNADLSESQFDSASLQHAIFKTATLRNVLLTGANLSGASFEQADLDGSDFSKANLDGADFRFAVNLDHVKSWVGASLNQTQFPNGYHPTR